MVREPNKTVIRNQSHPNSQSSDGEDVDEKDALPKKKDKQEHGVDVSELETFWRYYVA